MSSSPGAGFEYPSQDVAWLKRDVLLFAHTVGCTVDELHFLYVCLSVLSVCCALNLCNNDRRIAGKCHTHMAADD